MANPRLISADMDLSEVLDGMDVNGAGAYTISQAEAMRSAIVQDAPSYGWKTLGDIEDVDWFRMLDSITAHTVNATGLVEIRQFLAANHKLGGDHFTDAMIGAWAEGAEFQLAQGNPPTIEIPAHDSVSGRPEIYTISTAGIDTAPVEVD